MKLLVPHGIDFEIGSSESIAKTRDTLETRDAQFSHPMLSKERWW